MQGTVSIPDREDRIVCKIVGLVNISVQTAVLPVDIGIDTRINHGMIQRGIKHRQLVVVTFCLYAGKFLVPGIRSLCRQLVEAVTGCFRTKILQGTVGTHTGKGYLDF